MMSLDRIKRRDVLDKLLPGQLDALLQQLDAPGERFAHHAQAHDLADWLDAQPDETRRTADALLRTVAPELCACATQGTAEAWMARQHQHYRSQLPEGTTTATVQARLSTARETITQALARLRRPIRPDAGHRGMVLLGPPGSGKTAALLQAWCDAYDQWITDPDQPVPVYLTGALLQHAELHGLSRPIQAVAALEGFDATGLVWLPQPVLLLLDGLDDLPRPALQAIARWAISIPWDERLIVVIAMRDDAWDATLTNTLRPLLPFDLLPHPVTDPQDVSRLRVGSRWRCEALGMEFVWVPPGSFFMGATTAPGPGHDLEAGKDEAPAHEVTITRGFWLGRFPVTNRQIRAFADETSAGVGSLGRVGFDGPEQPAAEIDWYDAVRFCAWASRRTGLCVTLPTEAEWEYAARGTDGRKYPWGDAPLSLDRLGARRWSLTRGDPGDGPGRSAPRWRWTLRRRGADRERLGVVRPSSPPVPAQPPTRPLPQQPSGGA